MTRRTTESAPAPPWETEPQAATHKAGADSRLNRHLRRVKAELDCAQRELSEREWHTLRAILQIRLHREDDEE